MKALLKIVILSFAFVLLFGCTKKGGSNTGFVGPFKIVIELIDKDNGDNLLNPNTPNNYLNNKISAEYLGVNYPLIKSGINVDEMSTILSGLFLVSDVAGNVYVAFGNFNGQEDWDDTFTISWGDGTTDTIRFVHDVVEESYNNFSIVKQELYLNGNLVTDGLRIKK